MSFIVSNIKHGLNLWRVPKEQELLSAVTSKETSDMDLYCNGVVLSTKFPLSIVPGKR